MKVIVYTEYGSLGVLQHKEVEKPAPQDDEVLVKVHAAAVTIGEVIVGKGWPFHQLGPRAASADKKPRT